AGAGGGAGAGRGGGRGAGAHPGAGTGRGGGAGRGRGGRGQGQDGGTGRQRPAHGHAHAVNGIQGRRVTVLRWRTGAGGRRAARRPPSGADVLAGGPGREGGGRLRFGPRAGVGGAPVVAAQHQGDLAGARHLLERGAVDLG